MARLPTASCTSPFRGRPGESAAECGLSFVGTVCFVGNPLAMLRMAHLPLSGGVRSPSAPSEPPCGRRKPPRHAPHGPLPLSGGALTKAQQSAGYPLLVRFASWETPSPCSAWPISPFQGAFGRLRLPQSRPAGGRGGRKLSGGCNDGCISTYCYDIYCITIRFALSYAARRAALRPALPAERPLKGGDGPAAGWRGGAPPAPTMKYRIVWTNPHSAAHSPGRPLQGGGDHRRRRW